MSKLEPKRNVYVGHRYVPKIFGEWDKQNQYEGLSIVTHQGASYTSKKRVPVGINISNEEYWVVTGNYNAQIEDYRQETERVKNLLDQKVDITDYNEFQTEVNLKLEETNQSLDEKVNTTDYNEFQQTLNTRLEQSRQEYEERFTQIEEKELSEKLTLKVPSEYPNLPTALTKATSYKALSNVIVEIMIESGHKIDTPCHVSDTDLSHVRISSVDNVVFLDDKISGRDLFVFSNCIAPTMNVLINCEGKNGKGFVLQGASSGKFETDCGIINSGGSNLEAQNGSVCDANYTDFSGAGEESSNIRAVWGSIISAYKAVANDSQHYGVVAGYGSMVNFVYGTANNNGRHNVRASMGSIVSAQYAKALNGGEHGFYALDSSLITARSTDASGTQNSGYFANNGSTISAQESKANDCRVGVRCEHGSTVSIISSEISNCTDHAIQCEKSSTVEARHLKCYDTGGHAVQVDENSNVNIQGGYIRNPGLHGIKVNNLSRVNARACTIRNTNTGNANAHGVRCENGSVVNLKNGQVWNNGGRDLFVDDGGVIYANDCFTSSNAVSGGDNINKVHVNDINLTALNSLTRLGYITG